MVTEIIHPILNWFLTTPRAAAKATTGWINSPGADMRRTRAALARGRGGLAFRLACRRHSPQSVGVVTREDLASPPAILARHHEHGTFPFFFGRRRDPHHRQ